MDKNKSVVLILFITMMFLFIMSMLIFGYISFNDNGGFNTMIYYIYS
jgi:hypothetical protein